MPAADPDIQVLKKAMKGRSLAWLARKTGLAHRRVEAIMEGHVLTEKAARKIEVALGRAIWTDPALFKRMQAAAAWLALPVDPFIHGTLKLVVILRGKGIFTPIYHVTRAKLNAAIFAAYDKAHSKVKAPK